jgi:hypothetical protein
MNDANRALEVLRKRGWTKRTMKDARGRVCMAGAVRHGIYPVEAGNNHKFIALSDVEVIQEAAEVIKAEYPDRLWNPQCTDVVGVVAMFNDHEYTGLADVERVYEKVSARLDEKA